MKSERPARGGRALAGLFHKYEGEAISGKELIYTGDRELTCNGSHPGPEEKRIAQTQI